VKDLSQRFTVMPISRRHNEHKTRPCSLVLMRRPVPASYVVLRPSFPQRRSSFLFVLLCLHQRRHAEVLYFPWAVQRMEAQPSPTGKATQHAAIVSTVRIHVWARNDRGRVIQDIDFEFHVSTLIEK